VRFTVELAVTVRVRVDVLNDQPEPELLAVEMVNVCPNKATKGKKINTAQMLCLKGPITNKLACNTGRHVFALLNNFIIGRRLVI
jgi:hypothetical protein